MCSVDLSPILLHWFSVPVQAGFSISLTAWVTTMSPCHRASLSRWSSLEWEEPDSARAAQRSVLTVRTVRITNRYRPTLDRTSSDDLAPTQSSQPSQTDAIFLSPRHSRTQPQSPHAKTSEKGLDSDHIGILKFHSAHEAG